MDKILERLSFYATTETEKPLRTMTTLRIGGNAKYVVYPETYVAIDGIFRIIEEYQLPFKVIGKGSDLLCSDDEFEGVVICLDRFFNHNCRIFFSQFFCVINLMVICNKWTRNQHSSCR